MLYADIVGEGRCDYVVPGGVCSRCSKRENVVELYDDRDKRWDKDGSSKTLVMGILLLITSSMREVASRLDSLSMSSISRLMLSVMALD